jgi:hypothetical protein
MNTTNSIRAVACIRFVRLLAAPLLVFIYVGCLPLLLTRNVAHIACRWMDTAFDGVCKICGWDNRFWPLPKASDEPLPCEPNK